MISLSQMLQQAVQYHQAGNLHQAELLYLQILKSDPRHVEALNLMGVIAHQVGRNELAVEYIRQALRLRPQYPEAHNNLGIALQAQGKLGEAITSYHKSLRLKSDNPQAHFNLGNALKDKGKLEEAIASYRQAVRLKPDYAEAYNNLGTALKDQGNLAEAIDNFQQAIRLMPNYAPLFFNLGGALQEQGRLQEAVDCYRQAVRLNPDYAEAYNNLGAALNVQGKLADAIDSYQQALWLKPDYAETHNNLGNVLKDQGKLEEAITHYQEALRLKPDYADAYNNLGNALKDQGKLEEAIALYQQALKLEPDATTHDSLITTMHYHPGYDATALYQEARRWNDLYAKPLEKYRKPHGNTADPERRLRIGYVSPDFRNHAVSYLLMPLFLNHDHGQMEIFCYAEVTRPDDVTERFRACADAWRVTVGLTDEQMADMVRKDRIDILVDLASHTAHNRLLVFARKPAPVQVPWGGFLGTTGMSTMDYRLTDPFLDPPGENDSCYCEPSISLPDTFWCYDPQCDQPPVNELPALVNGFITFGCLNTFTKVNDRVLMLWAKVLCALPQSRLLLLAPKGYPRDHALAMLRQHGVDEARVEFADRRPRPQYFQLYHRIDLGLDLLPFNGHTTSFDAFWMGVPTITQIGKTVVGRVGWSQLCNLGLPELAAKTPEEFVKITVQLAQDLTRLQELRASLRERMRVSPLMDGKRFAGNMEQAYRQMWGTWCQKEARA